MKRALITGCSGQDASYLAELLLNKDYKIFGLVRRSSTQNLWRIEHIKDKITLISGDLTDSASVRSAVEQAEPDEVYNLGAQSFVPHSFTCPTHTFMVNAVGCINVLEAIKNTNKRIKFYQASSSEQFGKSEAPQNEETPFKPRSPYGISKVAAHQTTVHYREAYGIKASCGILFNHESERRGDEFVTQKIAKAVARISMGMQDKLELGNLCARRDWSHAEDCVRAMWMMLQGEPDDYVVGSGIQYSVREFVIKAFEYLKMDWMEYTDVNPNLVRPTDVSSLCADITKIKGKLGWEPKVTFDELVSRMMDNAIKIMGDELSGIRGVKSM